MDDRKPDSFMDEMLVVGMEDQISHSTPFVQSLRQGKLLVLLSSVKGKKRCYTRG